MMKLILFCLVALLSHLAYSQSCVMNEEAKRHYSRGVAATKIAQSTDDYKNALVEYRKAVELCPDCSELYYRMGLCCEFIGEDDNSYYSFALKYFQKSLAVDKNISQDLKDLIQGKIYEMEYAVEQAAVTNKDTLTPENLCGRWTFHTSGGETNKLYDIVIIQNQGFYSVEFTMINQHEVGMDHVIPDVPTYTYKHKFDVSFKDDVICFSTIHNRVIFYKIENFQSYHSKVEFNYELILENGVLKGTRKCISNFEAMGHSDYRRVTDAVKAGYGKVISNCTGDCGASNIYFTR